MLLAIFWNNQQDRLHHSRVLPFIGHPAMDHADLVADFKRDYRPGRLSTRRDILKYVTHIHPVNTDPDVRGII